MQLAQDIVDCPKLLWDDLKQVSRDLTNNPTTNVFVAMNGLIARVEADAVFNNRLTAKGFSWQKFKDYLTKLRID